MVRIFYLSLFVAALVSCSPDPKPVPRERGVALYFTEQDSTDGATAVRMILGAKFLRIDSGESAADFVLYDRTTRTIYNVNAADRLVLVIAPQPAARTHAPKLQHRVKRDTATFPAVDGKPVVHYRLLTNGRVCYDVYAAEGLLPEAVGVLREYREALAGEQTRAIGFVPNEMKAPCDLANHVYLPARHLLYGFPVRLVEYDARDPKHRRTTEFTDYRGDFEIAPQLFSLPADFRRMTIRELQGAKTASSK